MAAKQSDSGESISEINIVPLVDIILVVLIIFMVTAPTMVASNLGVDLPGSSAGEASESQALQIGITADERILFNSEEVDEDQVRRISQERLDSNPDVQALIAADRSVSHGFVVKVMDLLKTSGIKNLAVTTDQSVHN